MKCPKLINLAFIKLRAMAGGAVGAVLTLLLAFAMFVTAAAALNTPKPEKLVLAVVDESNTALSARLTDMLAYEKTASVKLIPCQNLAMAEALIGRYGAEGTLVIEKNFDEALAGGGTALAFYAAPGTSSAEAAEEIIAANAVALRSRLRSRIYSEELLGRGLTAEELTKLEVLADAALEREGAFAETQVVGSGAVAGSSVFGAFYARYAGFAAFIVMLCLLMLGAFTGSADARSAAQRIRSLRAGEYLEAGANMAALVIFGLCLLILSYIAGGAPKPLEALAGVAFVFCTAALSMLLGSFAGSERAEIASPFIALITSLAGGCFINPEAIGGALKTLSFFTPQGLYLSALNGRWACIIILVLAGLLMTVLCLMNARAAAQKRRR